MLAISLALSLLLSATATSAATTCNGHAELCNKSFGNVSFVGAHDSYAVGTNNLAVNQDYDITQQLNDGIRMLQMQAHNQSGTIQLCHTTCLLYNGGTLEAYLTKVKSWMDANTNDVVSLLIVNIDNLAASEFGTVFASVGLDKLSYAPSSSPIAASSWPTLGTLIDAGTRLVTFLDNAADLTSVPYLIDEFTNIWETPFDVTDQNLLNKDCSVNRTKGDTSTQMYLINHFFDMIVFGSPAPNVDAANVTNSVASLGAQVDTCVAAYSRAPNFMLVDFYEYGGGSVFEVAASINGVTYSPTSAIATPKPTSSTTSTTTSSTGGAVPLMAKSQLVAYILVAAGVMFGASSVA